MGDQIRVRACVAVVEDGKILLVPHFNTVAGPVQWTIPGGKVDFGESMKDAALREFWEETGLQADITGLLDVSEVIRMEQPWHSVTITFTGRVIGGNLAPEANHRYGRKNPRWLTADEVLQVACHPQAVVEKALGILK